MAISTWKWTSTADKRSSRQLAIRDWVCRLTGAESATAVNNNAAATVIVLRALCRGKEVILSARPAHRDRRQFSHPRDHGRSAAPSCARSAPPTSPAWPITSGPSAPRRPACCACTPATTASPASPRLSRWRTSCPSGASTTCLSSTTSAAGPCSTSADSALKASRWPGTASPPGPTLYCSAATSCSAAPRPASSPAERSGFRRSKKIRSMRAFRLDKMTLAALEATLRLYLDTDKALREVPVLRMLNTPLPELRHAGRNAGPTAASNPGPGQRCCT